MKISAPTFYVILILVTSNPLKFMGLGYSIVTQIGQYAPVSADILYHDTCMVWILGL